MASNRPTLVCGGRLVAGGSTGFGRCGVCTLQHGGIEPFSRSPPGAAGLVGCFGGRNRAGAYGGVHAAGEHGGVDETGHCGGRARLCTTGAPLPTRRPRHRPNRPYSTAVPVVQCRRPKHLPSTRPAIHHCPVAR